MTAMHDAGLYIVTLNNELPISVNANDPRVAHKCIQVSRPNCKFGKAKNLARRREDYGKVFGTENVNFRAVALTADIGAAERLVLKALAEWRVRGRTGRKNEWLVGISDAEVERIAIASLEEAGIAFAFPDAVSRNGASIRSAGASRCNSPVLVQGCELANATISIDQGWK